MRKPVSVTPPWVAPVAVVAAVALLVAAFLIIRWYTTPVAPPPLTVDATQQVVSSITSLAPSELDAVGTGSANNLIKKVSGSPLAGPNGEPEVFYMGAEYCPYCGAERWPMIIALSCVPRSTPTATPRQALSFLRGWTTFGRCSAISTFTP